MHDDLIFNFEFLLLSPVDFSLTRAQFNHSASLTRFSLESCSLCVLWWLPHIFSPHPSVFSFQFIMNMRLDYRIAWLLCMFKANHTTLNDFDDTDRPDRGSLSHFYCVYSSSALFIASQVYFQVFLLLHPVFPFPFYVHFFYFHYAIHFSVPVFHYSSA